MEMDQSNWKDWEISFGLNGLTKGLIGDSRAALQQNLSSGFGTWIGSDQPT